MSKTEPAAEFKTAVLIPCYNEEATIGHVVRDFRQSLPAADIYVYDNNSLDNTMAVAREAGATIGQESRQGKGNVLRRMFADIDADVYVLVDGDRTYDAASAPVLVRRLVEDRLDMVVACRVTEEEAAYRAGHRFGNAMLTGFVASMFGKEFNDILSGYRALSKRYVKSFPAMSSGFEVETELTVHALALRMPVAQVQTDYQQRPEGSVSKLNTYSDGLRILVTIFRLLKMERPFKFFGVISVILFVCSLVLAYPILMTYMDTGLVPRFPTAILSTGLMILAFLSLTSGMILETVTRGRLEAKRIAYLAVRK